MEIEKRSKGPFTVIGKEGSTEEGEGFIQKLWEEANACFQEIEPLAKRDEKGNLQIWGLMSGFARDFAPWDSNFTRGLYLAGVECQDDAQPPEGWTKWRAPGFDYLVIEGSGPEAFQDMLKYMEAEGYRLAGAVQDCTCNGKNYQCFPIRRWE